LEIKASRPDPEFAASLPLFPAEQLGVVLDTFTPYYQNRLSSNGQRS